jgi:hypothetical protein
VLSTKNKCVMSTTPVCLDPIEKLERNPHSQ